jgi:HK97 family phage major capsid protein
MAARKLRLGTMDRSFGIDRAAINEKERTVELSFSSETPVRRWFGFEVLDHSNPSSCDLSRFKDGASVVVEHDGNQLCGVIEAARIDPKDKMGRAKVRFGTSTFAEEIFKDVREGIRSLVSIRYRVGKMVTEKVEEGVETLRATKWEPYHISFVADPADASVGVGRGANVTEQNETEIEEMRILLDPAPGGGGGGGTATVTAPNAPTAADGAKSERQRQTGLREVARKAKARFDKPEEIDAALERALADETSLEDFRIAMFEKLANLKPVETPDTASVGMTDKEVKRYSLVRAMYQLANKQPLDGIEREASDQVAKNLRKKPDGFFVPTDVAARSFAESKDMSTREVLRALMEMQQIRDRALVSNVFNAGGALVGTDLLTGSLIELLRNQMFVMEMGARNLTGLVGDVAIPRQSGGATAYWLAVGASLTRSQQVLEQLALTPHRLAAATAYDKQLLAQSSLSVEGFVRQDLMAVLAIEKDRACINGKGAEGEPLGILKYTGMSTPVTFGTAAAPLFTDYIKFETNLATNNADRGALGYLVHPTVRGDSKGRPKFTSTGTPIWENDTVNGYKARATNQVPVATSVIFGRWDDLIVADWDGLDVVVDPYTLSLNGQISVVIQMFTDNGLRHAKSFSVSTN